AIVVLCGQETWVLNIAPVFEGFDAGSVYLVDLSEVSAEVGYGKLGKRGDLGYDGHDAKAPRSIIVKGIPMSYSLSAHPYSNGISRVVYDLGGRWRLLSGAVALNDDSGRAATAATFKVVGDGRELWRSKPIQMAGVVQEMTVDVSGVKRLELIVDCPGSYGNVHAIWLDPKLSE
ncbi:MAG: NPCBM/NEW2 domain-containing protein, partial [Planctomycetota bacterium]|nr:NPCBM/NEW2 domain-containing protein [Planctomycetota bacterium]